MLTRSCQFLFELLGNVVEATSFLYITPFIVISMFINIVRFLLTSLSFISSIISSYLWVACHAQSWRWLPYLWIYCIFSSVWLVYTIKLVYVGLIIFMDIHFLFGRSVLKFYLIKFYWIVRIFMLLRNFHFFKGRVVGICRTFIIFLYFLKLIVLHYMTFFNHAICVPWLSSILIFGCFFPGQVNIFVQDDGLDLWIFPLLIDIWSLDERTGISLLLAELFLIVVLKNILILMLLCKLINNMPVLIPLTIHFAFSISLLIFEIIKSSCLLLHLRIE